MIMIVSNNPSFAQCGNADMKNDTHEVLVYARNLIHRGHKLINHPLYGNIQPRYWYYRSLILTQSASEKLDYFSLQLIETAIQAYRGIECSQIDIPEDLLEDYRMVDKEIVFQALQRVRTDANENKKNERR